jgi:thymidylate synthase (FAD)
MYTTYYATVDLNNFIHFLELRDSDHSQWEIRVMAQAMKELVKDKFPNVFSVVDSK